MSDFEAIDVAFSRTGGATTRVSIVPLSDRGLVDLAVAALMEHQILGLAVFSTPRLRAQDYSPIAVMAISSGVDTFLFTVGFDVRREDIAKIYIDYGVAVEPIHDLRDILAPETGSASVFEAFQREFPGGTFRYQRDVKSSDWWRRDLDEAQISLAAFDAWAIRYFWLIVAQPKGYPVQARTQGIEVSEITQGIVRETFPGQRQPYRRDDRFVEHEVTMREGADMSTSFAATGWSSHGGVSMRNTRSAAENAPQGGGEPVAPPPSFAASSIAPNGVPQMQAFGRGLEPSDSIAAHLQPTMAEHTAEAQQAAVSFEMQEDVNPETFSCPYCERSFETYAILQQHMYARVNGLCYPDGPGEASVDMAEDQMEDTEWSAAPGDAQSGANGHHGGGVAFVQAPNVSMIPRDDDDELAAGSYAPGQAAQATSRPSMAQQQPASTDNGNHNPSAATQAAAVPQNELHTGGTPLNSTTRPINASRFGTSHSILASRTSLLSESVYGNDLNLSMLPTSAAHRGVASMAKDDRPTHLDNPNDTATGAQATGEASILAQTMRWEGGANSTMRRANAFELNTTGAMQRAGGSRPGWPDRSGFSIGNISGSHAGTKRASGSNMTWQAPSHEAASSFAANESRDTDGFRRPSTLGQPRSSSGSTYRSPNATTRTAFGVHHPQGVYGRYSDLDHSVRQGDLTRSDVNMTRYHNQSMQAAPGEEPWLDPPNRMPVRLAVASTAGDVGRF
ncbi:uncharacterized protein MONBRDRAFT_34671 [Monosiga brevicollis MX1]|uniref:C2H2-type domain-containing protein n=1 Tax=Monosiga brevicollis TaxID=81824 RepID=A9VD93_MONBE|nr:uncharacterized protein MONBRDRAFT_34671 [Monosiga brevicollis MX1]EDQ84489.1 predicted protein [Monosiga brevicollis MX1]|eukprot:XP_001750676.1 hypothetical protein [Monosiga brevicollis MX1]